MRKQEIDQIVLTYRSGNLAMAEFSAQGTGGERRWRRNTAIIASAVVGLMLSGAIVPAAVRADAVDNYIAAKMAEKSIPGLSLAVIRDGHVIKEKAYGYANLELKAPLCRMSPQ